VKLQKFSTDFLPEKTRVQDARDIMMETTGSDIRPLGSGPFYNHVAVRPLPGLEIGRIELSPASGTRTKGYASGRSDDLECSLMIKGATMFSSPVLGDTTVSAGQMLIVSGDAPGTGSMAEESRRSWINIPRRLLKDAGVDLGVITSLPQTPELQFLTKYVAWLTGDGVVVPETAEGHVAHHIADLFILALDAKGEAAEIARGRGLMAARFNAVKADIRSRLADGNLRLDDVARRQGISPGYLRALFDRHGSSFTDFVLSERLAMAHGLLASPRHLGRTIADIAFSCGFNDLSYFNRAFKRRFGMTPRDARMGGQV
jgi:AraC-like DNA-binding protein